MTAWERLPDETEPAFAAFQVYLETAERSGAKVAQKIHKSPSLIRRWASKYGWKERAREWDNSVIERTRTLLSRRLVTQIQKQWEQSTQLQDKAFDNIVGMLDKRQGSLKSLTELYNSAAERQMALADRIGAGQHDDEIKIIIEDATKTGGD